MTFDRDTRFPLLRGLTHHWAAEGSSSTPVFGGERREGLCR